MQKKNVLMMTMSLAMVGVVAVGGTLAYLTSNTKTLTNTFTVGEGYDADDFKLDETDVIDGLDGVKTNPTAIDPHDREESANEYAPVAPGSRIAKDPTFYLKNDAPESWVVAEVTGVDALVDTNYIVVSNDAAASVTNDTSSALNTTDWTKVANSDGSVIGAVVEEEKVEDDGKLDGYYVYIGSTQYNDVTKEGYTSLQPLFKSVYVKSTVSTSDQMAEIKEAFETNIVVKGVAVQKDNISTAAAAFEAAKTVLNNQ